MSLAFPPDLDNTSRKFIHEAVKKLGLDSKSRGKGVDRYITVSKKKGSGGGGGGEGAELPPMLQLGQARDNALEAYFSRRPPAAREVEAVMSSAVGGGMHAAAELVTQKRHKVRRGDAALETRRGGVGGEVVLLRRSDCSVSLGVRLFGRCFVEGVGGGRRGVFLDAQGHAFDGYTISALRGGAVRR